MAIASPPHPAFPLQGLVTATPSRTDIRVEYKEIHTSEPIGSWTRLAGLLNSISELYIIFERVSSTFLMQYELALIFLLSFFLDNRYYYPIPWWFWQMIQQHAVNLSPPRLT